MYSVEILEFQKSCYEYDSLIVYHQFLSLSMSTRLTPFYMIVNYKYNFWDKNIYLKLDFFNFLGLHCIWIFLTHILIK